MTRLVRVALRNLVTQTDAFADLGQLTQKSVISTLLDLRAPLGAAFWQELAARTPGSLGVMAFSGLLGHGPRTAMRILPMLPDEEAIADALFVVIEQHAIQLNPPERASLVAEAREVQPDCNPQIATALGEWMMTVGDLPAHEEEAPKDRSHLNSALAAAFERFGKNYQPNPTSARLTEAVA